MADVIGAYDLDISTGPDEDESSSRAQLGLRGDRGSDLGTINFYGPGTTLEHDFVSRGNLPIMHLHTDMLAGVLALLDGDKPVFVDFDVRRGGRLTTHGREGRE